LNHFSGLGTATNWFK